MRSQVEQFHFVVHYAHRNLNGGITDVETNLSVFDQKTLAIVQTIADRRMFGFVGKGNFSLVPVKTGSGEIPLNHMRFPLFERRGRGERWYRRSYADLLSGLQERLFLGGETLRYGSKKIIFGLSPDRISIISVEFEKNPNRPE